MKLISKAVLLVTTILLSCKQDTVMSKYDIPKHISFLPHSIDEVSGLAYHSEKTLIMVNDEKGKIYYYDYQSKVISKVLEFGKDGDYEGIAYAEPYIFVAKSNGNIYQLNENTQEVIKHKLPFTNKNNVEGLCSLSSNELLIALKDRGGFDGKKNKKHAIYKFNLKSKITTTFIEFESDKKIGWSGIAVFKNRLFALSHRSSELYEFDTTTKELLEKNKLRGQYFPQPEGICFDLDGNLFISNEQADRDRATLLQF